VAANSGNCKRFGCENENYSGGAAVCGKQAGFYNAFADFIVYNPKHNSTVSLIEDSCGRRLAR
jgi:hypothetical protein